MTSGETTTLSWMSPHTLQRTTSRGNRGSGSDAASGGRNAFARGVSPSDRNRSRSADEQMRQRLRRRNISAPRSSGGVPERRLGRHDDAREAGILEQPGDLRLCVALLEPRAKTVEAVVAHGLEREV